MTPLAYFEARWNAVLQPALGVQLVVPSNFHLDVEQLTDPWAGVLVQSQEFRNITMGSRPWQEETGIFQLGIFAKAGDGFANQDVLLRQVRDSYMNWTSSDNVIRIESVAGPLDIDPQASDGSYQLAMELRYQAWTQPPEELDMQDAPADGHSYVRRNGQWARMPPDIISLEYSFNAQTEVPPGAGQVRFDNADPTLVTKAWLAHQTADGIDVSVLVNAIFPGAVLRFADKDAGTPWAQFNVATGAVERAGYAELGVAYTSGSGGPLNAQRIIATIMRT